MPHTANYSATQQCAPPPIEWFSRTVPGGAADVKEYAASAEKRPLRHSRYAYARQLVLPGSRSSRSSLSSQRGHSWVQFFKPMSAMGILQQPTECNPHDTSAVVAGRFNILCLLHVLTA